MSDKFLNPQLKPEDAKLGEYVHRKHLHIDDSPEGFNTQWVKKFDGEYKRVDRDWFKKIAAPIGASGIE